MIQNGKNFNPIFKNKNLKNIKIYGSSNQDKVVIKVKESIFIIKFKTLDSESKADKEIKMEVSELLSFKNISKALYSIMAGNSISDTIF